MKRLFIIALALCMCLPLLSACSKGGENGVVNVFNWGENIDKEVLEIFERETGIKVNYKTYDSNEILYSKLKTDASSYDVIIPSDYMISRLIEEGMIQKINMANVPNISLIGDQFKNQEYDPTGEYSVAYTWGTLGLIYNSSVVSEPVDSWGLMFDAQYAGQVLQIDNPRDAVAIALIYLGYSINTTEEAEIREAFEFLEGKKKSGQWQKYVMDQVYDLLEGGEAAIGTYYAGDFLMMYENNPDLRFVIPKEGSNRFTDAMCITAGAKNKDNAEAFINFMCDTETCIANMAETGYASPNTEAAEAYQDEFDLDVPEEKYQYDIMYPSPEILDNCEIYVNLPAHINDLYAKLWGEFRS